MKIDIPTIKAGYQYVCSLTGQVAQRTVKWIDSASIHFQSFPNSYAALIVANIVFFEIALAVCRIANHLFNKYKDYHDLDPHERCWRSLNLGLLFVTALGGANRGFCKEFRIPLSGWKVVTISILTSFIYFYLRNLLDKE